MSKNLKLSHKSYVAVLERQLERIQADVPLQMEDSTEIGNKYTECSWGLCSDSKEVWPDPQDHIWPDEFIKHGRSAPLYRDKGQLCPFDNQDKIRDATPKGEPSGCFYRCMIFKPGKLNGKRQTVPSRERAEELYQIRIKNAKAT